MTDSVGIVIPAYRPDVTLLCEYVDSLREGIDPDEIRIELDAPEADVGDELETLPATVNAVDSRRGKGAALTAGFESLGTDVFAFADADGSTPAPELVRIVSSLDEGPVDLAVGSRRHPDATVETSQSPTRQYLGDGFAWLARQLLEVSLYDYQCGAKAITAEGWDAVRHHLTQPGFAWDVELVAVAGAVDLEVREIPITWYDQPNSTVPPIQTSAELATALVRAALKTRRLDPGPLYSTLVTADGESPTCIERDPLLQNDE